MSPYLRVRGISVLFDADYAGKRVSLEEHVSLGCETGGLSETWSVYPVGSGGPTLGSPLENGTAGKFLRGEMVFDSKGILCYTLLDWLYLLGGNWYE